MVVVARLQLVVLLACILKSCRLRRNLNSGPPTCPGACWEGQFVYFSDGANGDGLESRLAQMNAAAHS